MRKIFVIARREYAAAVRSKAFIVSLVLMPVLMAGSAGVQVLFHKLEDMKEKRFAVIDRTPGQSLKPSLERSLERYNTVEIFDREHPGKQDAPKFALEFIPPSEGSPEAMNEQRYEISQRIEKGELEGLLEIGRDVVLLPRNDRRTNPPDEEMVRFQAKNPTQRHFSLWAQRAVNDAVLQERCRREHFDVARLMQLQRPVPIEGLSLTTRNAKTGEVRDADKTQQFVNLFLPAVLIALMFMVIMVGATPAMQGIVEEKSQRIAEVLLGSVTPTQLMAGKLLGLAGVSLTMAAVYLGGGYVVAARAGLAGALTPNLVFWFAVCLVLALLMFGSLFIAIGAAVTEIKETQTLLTPVMLIACVPFFALGPIMQDPNGVIARVCTFFPFATPMVLVARESVPPGVPAWEMVLGILLVLATTLFCVWAAGRIFRVGILMTGKGARLTELVRWVVRG